MEEVWRVPQLWGGVNRPPKAQDPGLEEFSEGSMYTFQPVTLKVVGPAKRNVPGESCLSMSFQRPYNSLHRRAEGTGIGTETQISEAKVECEPPARAMPVRGHSLEHRTQGSWDMGAQKLGKQEAVMGSHVCTACLDLCAGQGGKAGHPESPARAPLGHPARQADSAGVDGSLSPPWCGRVCLDQEAICCQLSFSGLRG